MIRRFVCILLLVGGSIFAAEEPLPAAQEWRTHLESDLMRFWMTPEAIGVDGNFPTYRCNNGSMFDAAKPCPELAEGARGVVYLDRDYLRMQSRQVYCYGVAYQVTGDEKYLEQLRKGAQWMMRHGFEEVDGALVPVSFWKNGKAMPRPPQRTSQDSAYSLTGLGFYYVVTRDPEALRYVKAVKEYTFANYWDSGQRIIRWVHENFMDETADRWELTAQLDQVYAYMIWLTPALPVADQEPWKKDLIRKTRGGSVAPVGRTQRQAAPVMKRKRPKPQIADAVTREHGAKYAKEWFERSFDTFSMFEAFQATNLMKWPRDGAAQGLFQDIEDAICESAVSSR